MTEPIHDPGSADAVALGCTCDLIKNDFGRGKSSPTGLEFWCDVKCPIHGALVIIVEDNPAAPIPDDKQANGRRQGGP